MTSVEKNEMANELYNVMQGVHKRFNDASHVKHKNACLDWIETKQGETKDILLAVMKDQGPEMVNRLRSKVDKDYKERVMAEEGRGLAMKIQGVISLCDIAGIAREEVLRETKRRLVEIYKFVDNDTRAEMQSEEIESNTLSVS